MILLSLGEECPKKSSWALSYQEWQNCISSGQNYHDGEIEASAVGNKEVESEEEASNLSSDDSDKSMKSSDDYDSKAADASNDKKEGQTMFAIEGR